MRSGWTATKIMIALRWRMIRDKNIRRTIIFSSIFVALGLGSSINIGYAVELTMKAQDGNALVSYQNAIAAFLRNIEGNAGSIFLLAIFGLAVFTPLAGTSTLSLIPTDDMQGIRPNVAHKYFDSLVINLVSGVSVLQLLTLTCFASLISINSLRVLPMIFIWSLWFLFIQITTAVGWVVEWGARRFKKNKKFILSLTLAAIILGGMVAYIYYGFSPYGFGNFILSRLLETNSGLGIEAIVDIFSLWGIILIFFYIGTYLAKKALSYAQPANTKSFYHKAKKPTVSVTRITFRLVTNCLWRTVEIRKPILALMLFGIPAVSLSPLHGYRIFGLIIAIPMTIALSGGVNIFGILGLGFNWLGAQPKLVKKIPLVAFFIQVAVDYMLIFILWFIAFLAGKSSLADGFDVFRSASFVILGTSVLSTYLSITFPKRIQVSGRGNSIIPPLTALGYLILLVVVSGLPLFVLQVHYQSVLYRYGTLTIVILLELLVLFLENRKWGDSKIRSRIIHTVSAQ